MSSTWKNELSRTKKRKELGRSPTNPYLSTEPVTSRQGKIRECLSGGRQICLYLFTIFPITTIIFHPAWLHRYADPRKLKHFDF